ncbi:excinuclease ABC subunit UvrA [Helicobacter saguini]|uniref:UvrABC system protein A n=1 Tax=Helicobacter saguini TaxID=1548018 RepID=A0A347VTV4_9HELI|nr:excinuclease ABC subunit UvrA [Helicobacter saguini]MWV61482.1 excinuclease ABC subunit UvrA [Helicobacter saguini]MWV67847.1 excinuclease ABC subunit UvrA [Helicobacter saguini]MWV70685.1 excinuclease ABC subunit UvrA [Helicobacter saguini]MWV72589.1 excinuclease ABC subunit UvrA [Helicobacter saguini]TLD94619.1 excinuclease ABC subunit UvrA [Helicobacter saguini]
MQETPLDTQNYIQITGAKENNLKNINLKIPKNKLVVFTGLSGSGKSTLAFDTLYAEGQRRYIESLSSYVRQFLDKVGKPNVEKIDGLTPAIAIDQKTTSKNPRSTVGTITEIYDYLRLLYARVGEQFCHICGRKISSMSAQDIIDEVLKLPLDSKLIIYAPLVKDKKGSFAEKLESLRNKGYVRAKINGVITRLDEEISLSKTKKQTISLVIDRVVLKEENKTRIAQAIESGLKEAYGEIEVEILNDSKENIPNSEKNENQIIHYSEHLACFHCKVSFEPLEPLAFSFNSPKGACKECGGLGMKYSLDINSIIDKNEPLNKGGIKFIFGFNRSYYYALFEGFCAAYNIKPNATFNDLTPEVQNALLYGSSRQIEVEWRHSKLKQTWRGAMQIALDVLKEDASEYMIEKTCPACKGFRLNPQSLSVKVANKGIADVISMPIQDSYKFFIESKNFDYLNNQQKQISDSILKEIKERLFFLYDVGLGYLTLHRDARSISGGESQRIRIASQIGSGLTGVMYVLDEPSIGLHERDTLKLIKTLKSLQEKGNSVIVVEHDKETILNADFIVDIGPGAGIYGGEVVFSGSVKDLLKSNTISAQYLSGKKEIKYPHNRKQKEWISISNVTLHNLQNVSVKIPLSNFVCVTGVSGSGKSSLILQTLLPVAQELLNHRKKTTASNGVEIKGLENLDKVIYLDQSPIGRTPRSNPSTYTGLMDDLRNIFAESKEAKIRGYSVGRFSFNVKGGRCEKCQGEGEIKIEMHFLPDVMVQCDACKGTRYNAQTLEILYKGKNIADVLDMSVDEALEFFSKIPKIYNRLKTLNAVGLGYIKLGQSSLTLSGGEAQRIKLSKELSRKDTGKTLYILDEPTTGLHFADVDRLTGVLHRLVDLGNSVVVIEHNLDVIKNADYIIDMGPEGGSGGGKVIAVGSVDSIIANVSKTHSYTAQFLAKEIDG